MRILGLAMVTAGAILTFAVSAQVPGIDLRLAGVIIIVAGLAGLITPSGAGAWLRHRVLGRAEVVHGDVIGGHRHDPAAGEPDDVAFPAYLLQDPAVLAAEVLNGVRASRAGAARSGGQRAQPDDQDWQ